TAGEDVIRSPEAIATGHRELIECIVLRQGVTWRRNLRQAVLTAGCHEARHQCLYGPASHQRPEIGLPQPEFDSVPAKLRKTPRKLRAIEHLDGEAQLAMDLQGVGRIRRHALEEKERAVCVKNGQIRTPGEPFPLRERLPCHARVDLIRPIGRARQPRLTPRGGTWIGGSGGIEQKYALSPVEEIPGGPRAKHAGADHDDVPAVASRAALSVGTRLSAQGLDLACSFAGWRSLGVQGP